MQCNNPTPFKPWEIFEMIPDADGVPTPLEYSLNHRNPHVLSVVDIDARDTRMSVSVDGKLLGKTTPFEFDKTVNCGEDQDTCIRNGFSMGRVILAPGKQRVKIEWAGEGTVRFCHGKFLSDVAI